MKYSPLSDDPQKIDVTKPADGEGNIVVYADTLLAILKEDISDQEKLSKI